MNAEQIAARLHRIIDEGPDPAEGLGNPLGIYSQGYQEGMRDLLAALREAGGDPDHAYEQAVNRLPGPVWNFEPVFVRRPLEGS